MNKECEEILPKLKKILENKGTSLTQPDKKRGYCDLQYCLVGLLCANK